MMMMITEHRDNWCLFALLLLLASGQHGIVRAAGHGQYGGVKSPSYSPFEPLPEANDPQSQVQYVNDGPLGQLYDFLIRMRLQRLCLLLRKASLEDVLANAGPLTIFAPIDGSFAFLPGGTLEELERNPRLLQEFLLHHVVSGDLSSSQITDEMVVNTLQGTALRFNIYSPGNIMTVSGAEILQPDLVFDLGRVHIIDRPLYPLPVADINGYLQANHREFYKLVLLAGLTDFLSSGTYTVFAPDDKAFDYLSLELKDALASNDTLAYSVVLVHLLPVSVFVRGVSNGTHMESIGGQDLTFTQRRGLTFVNGIPIVMPDVTFSNGVAHVINRVLLPEGVEAGCHCNPLSTRRGTPGTGQRRPFEPARLTTRRPSADVTPRPLGTPGSVGTGVRPVPGQRRPSVPVTTPGQRPSVTGPGQRPAVGPQRPASGARTPTDRPGIPSVTPSAQRPGVRPAVPPPPGRRPASPGAPRTPAPQATVTTQRPFSPGRVGQIPGSSRPGQMPRQPSPQTERPRIPGDVIIVDFTDEQQPETAPPSGTARDGLLPASRPSPGQISGTFPGIRTDQRGTRRPGQPQLPARRPFQTTQRPQIGRPGFDVVPLDDNTVDNQGTPFQQENFEQSDISGQMPIDLPRLQPGQRPGQQQPQVQPGRRQDQQPQLPSQRPGQQSQFQPGRRPGQQPQLPSQRPGQQPQFQPGRRQDQQPQVPSQRPGHQPQFQPGRGPGQQPQFQPGRGPGQQPQPGQRPGQQTFLQPGQRPGVQPVPRPGQQPQVQPGIGQPQQPGLQPAQQQPGLRPPQQPQQQPGLRPAQQQPGIGHVQRPLQPGRTPTQQQPGQRPGQQPFQPGGRPTQQPGRRPTQQGGLPGQRGQLQPPTVPGQEDQFQPETMPPGQVSEQPSWPGQQVQPPSQPGLPGPQFGLQPGRQEPTQPRQQTVLRPGQPQTGFQPSPATRPGFQQRPAPPTQRTTASPRFSTTARSPSFISGGRPGAEQPATGQQVTTRRPQFPTQRPGSRPSHSTKGQPFDPQRHRPQVQPAGRFPAGNPPRQGSLSTPSSPAGSPVRFPSSPGGQSPTCRRRGDRITPATQSLPLCPPTDDFSEPCQSLDAPYDPSDPRPMCEVSYSCRLPGEPADPADTRPLCPETTPSTDCRPALEPPLPGDTRPICDFRTAQGQPPRLQPQQVSRPQTGRQPPSSDGYSCRLPGEFAAPGDTRPLCTGDEAATRVTEGTRFTGSSPQQPPRSPSTPGSPQQGGLQPPGLGASTCRQPGERPVAGDRRPICTPGRPGSPQAPSQQQGYRPSGSYPSVPSSSPGSALIPSQQPGYRPGTSQSFPSSAPGSPQPPSQQQGYRPGTSPSVPSSVPGSSQLPSRQQGYRPGSSSSVPSSGSGSPPSPSQQPGYRPGNYPSVPTSVPGSPQLPSQQQGYRPGSPSSVPSSAPGTRRPGKHPSNVGVSNCRKIGERPTIGDRRPLCQRGTGNEPQDGMFQPGNPQPGDDGSAVLPGQQNPQSGFTAQGPSDPRQSSRWSNPGRGPTTQTNPQPTGSLSPTTDGQGLPENELDPIFNPGSPQQPSTDHRPGQGPQTRPSTQTSPGRNRPPSPSQRPSGGAPGVPGTPSAGDGMVPATQWDDMNGSPGLQRPGSGGQQGPGRPSTSTRPSGQQQTPQRGTPGRRPTSPAPPRGGSTTPSSGGQDSPRSLYEIVEDPALLIQGRPVKLTKIFELFNKAGLDYILTDPGPYTVFLPSDDAFLRLPKGVVEQLESDPELLRRVLLFHVTNVEVLPTRDETSFSVPSMQGTPLLITMLNSGRLILISGSKAVAVTRASNGIFYVINQLMYPLPQDDIVSALSTRPDLTQLNSLIEISGLQDTLRGDQPFTLFAPTDNAFSQLPEAAFQYFMQNTTALRELLMGHIIEGAHYGREFLRGKVFPNVRGGQLKLQVVSYGYQVNDIDIKTPEIVTGSGVIHVIDGILITPQDTILIGTLDNTLEGPINPSANTGRTSANIAANPGQGFLTFSTVSSTTGHGTSGHNSPVGAPGSPTSNLNSPSPVQSFSNPNQPQSSFGQRSPSSGHSANNPGQRSPGSTGFNNPNQRSPGSTGSNDPNQRSPGSTGSNHPGQRTPTGQVSPGGGGAGSPGNNPPQSFTYSVPQHSGVAQLANDIGLRKFAALITNTGLSEKVEDGGTYTILAPTDEALNSLPPDVAGALDVAPDQVMDLLRYHILPQKLTSSSLSNDETASTLLEGQRLRFNVYHEGQVLTALGVPVSQPQDDSSSVRIIVVNQVLQPPQGNLLKVVESSPYLTEFAKAVKNANLNWMLSGEGSKTLFAPSDVAFQALTEEQRKNMIENRQAFNELLKRHMVRGTLYTTGFEDGAQRRTENNKHVTLSVYDGGCAVNSVPITYSDIPATNGVVHIIDQFL